MMIQEEFSGSNDQIIIKGKRSKRPRPSSSTSTISCGGGGEFYNTMFFPSPSSSSTCTEEDEDMANCLILLATGGSPPPLEEEIKSPETKFSSRKFTEMDTTTIGKIGIYVYECKTCNRTFSSFQALGGHRASHKRTKTTADNIDRKISQPPPSPPPQKQEEGQCTLNSVIMSPPHSIQFLGKNENKQKIHECSICGSEFGSGQALGGHMRRHRAAATVNNNIKIGSVMDGDAPKAKARNIFALDLNLPAPPEDDRTDASFYQFSRKQRPHVIVSAAALVDCHY